MVQNKRSDDDRAQSLVPHKHYSKSGIIAGVLGEILGPLWDIYGESIIEFEQKWSDREISTVAYNFYYRLTLI